MFTIKELQVIQDALAKYKGKWSHNTEALKERLHQEQQDESIRIADSLRNRVEELLYDHFYKTTD